MFRRNQKGFALPMAVLALAVLALALTAGFAASSSETMNASAEEGSDRALAVAQAGLEQFLLRAHQTGYCSGASGSCQTNMATLISTPPDSEWVTNLALAGGRADVKAVRLHTGAGTAANPHIYYVRSRGVDTASKSASFWMRSTLPERTVGQYVYIESANVQVASAFTSITGILKNGGSGTIDGNDNCGGASAVAGVAVPASPGYQQNGGATVPTGNPPIQTIGADPTAAANAVTIDWNGIVNQGAITPDITIPGGSYPASTFSTDPNYYPVIMVNGDYSLPSAGRGTLIVTGNMTISGSNLWKGLVLVGGTLTSNGNNTVSGAIVAGLNVKLGMTVAVNSVGNGNKTFEYDSCELRNATAAMGGYVPLSNTWTGNLATY